MTLSWWMPCCNASGWTAAPWSNLGLLQEQQQEEQQGLQGY
jgi:hypothetical protein